MFYYIRLPAGLMVGSTFFIALASIGLEVITVPKGFIGVIQMRARVRSIKKYFEETFEVLASGELLITLLLLTLITIITSFVIALIVHKISKWDLATCLMACAPAGFTVMVALAIDYGKNSIQVTMLHMVRVLAIKICVLFFFLLFEAFKKNNYPQVSGKQYKFIEDNIIIFNVNSKGSNVKILKYQ